MAVHNLCPPSHFSRACSPAPPIASACSLSPLAKCVPSSAVRSGFKADALQLRRNLRPCRRSECGDLGSTKRLQKICNIQPNLESIPSLNMVKKELTESVRVAFKNSQGEELIGLLEDTKSPELCILCHGFRSSKNSSTLAAISSALVEAGVSTLRFDFSGNGESEGQFSYGNYWKEVEDLRAAIDYFRRTGRTVTTILGHSKGGSVVLLYSSKYGDVDCVVNLSGRYGLQAGIKERLGEERLAKIWEEGSLVVKDGLDSYTVTKAGLEERMATDLPAAAQQISEKCRVLTVHGARDTVVPLADAYKVDETVANHSLVVLEDGDHNFRTCRQQLISHVLSFVVPEVK